MGPEFTGYRRSDGRIGIRNHVVVLPTSVAASSIARGIADDAGEWARATPHQMGATQPDTARKQTQRVLAGVGRNPNAGAVLVVEFGTEDIDADVLADQIAQSGKPVETLTVRDVGGTNAALDRGEALVEALNEATTNARRERADASELILGVECGGSDATSGIAANPAVGDACDRLIEDGGTACFSETPEFIGAEHVLAERCVDQSTRERLLERVERREATADLMGVDLRGAQPSPGNQEGGLTTIEEKSLGAISKGGTSTIQGIVDYAEQLPVGGGLIPMDTPGYDIESVVGKVAGGAQIIVFTTGRGSTTGNPVAPVLKVTGNPNTWTRMTDNMDVNAGTIVEGTESISAVGERVYKAVISVADGERTGAERRRMEEFAITEVQPNELAQGGRA